MTKKIVQRIIKMPLHVSRANFSRRNSRKSFWLMKISWIPRRKIWILLSKNFKNLDFLRILSNTVHHVCLKVHYRVLRSVYSKKIRNFFKIQETFHGLSAIFLATCSDQHSTCPEKQFEQIYIFLNFNFSRNFAHNVSAPLSKRQSSCTEKKLWNIKVEKNSKIKQFFSDFDQKRVGRLVKTGSYVLRGIFWKVFRETQYLMFFFIVLREISWISIDKLFAGFNKTSVF